jgi:hypothetical protein
VPLSLLAHAAAGLCGLAAQAVADGSGDLMCPAAAIAAAVAAASCWKAQPAVHGFLLPCTGYAIDGDADPGVAAAAPGM